uniref:Uncharacterized protein n=1 Tax=Cucumis melo TaxID=3656 RepID=A0A9I9E6U6_CUCME
MKEDLLSKSKLMETTLARFMQWIMSLSLSRQIVYPIFFLNLGPKSSFPFSSFQARAIHKWFFPFKIFISIKSPATLFSPLARTRKLEHPFRAFAIFAHLLECKYLKLLGNLYLICLVALVMIHPMLKQAASRRLVSAHTRISNMYDKEKSSKMIVLLQSLYYLFSEVLVTSSLE